MTLTERLKDELKAAMKAKNKPRLGAIRLALSAIKQREVDERITLSDEDVIVILTKMIKQRRDSASQYEAADRQDLVDVELGEIVVLEEFMPQALTEAEVVELLDAALVATGATTMQDMGKLMAVLKPQVQGRADMGKVSQLVKAKLG
jgi:hypothetical protein